MNNDVTERRRTGLAREDVAEQWQAAFESNPTMYFIVDAEGTIVRVNAYGADKLGYTTAELIGRPVLDVCATTFGPTRWNASARASGEVGGPIRMPAAARRFPFTLPTVTGPRE